MKRKFLAKLLFVFISVALLSISIIVADGNKLVNRENDLREQAISVNEQKPSVSVATEKLMIPAQSGGSSNSYAVEPLPERIEKLSPEDKALAKAAKKSVGMYKDENGNYILIEVDGKKVHDDPAKKFLEQEGIKDKDKAVEVVE